MTEQQKKTIKDEKKHSSQGFDLLKAVSNSNNCKNYLSMMNMSLNRMIVYHSIYQTYAVTTLDVLGVLSQVSITVLVV